MLLEELYLLSRQGAVELDPFTYTATWNTLAASAAGTAVNISINADSDFVIRYGMLSAYSAAGVLVEDPDYLIRIFDTGAGRNFEDAQAHVRNYFGTAQRPFVWPEPKLVRGSSVLTLTLTNNTATAARVDVSFGGLKVFKFASAAAFRRVS